MTQADRLRRLAVGGGLALITAFAAGVSASASAVGKSPTPVVFWDWSQTGLPAVDNQIIAAMQKSFDHAYPQYKLEVSMLPAATFRTKDFAALQANKPVDVFAMDNADLSTYFNDGAIMPINRYLPTWSTHLRMNLFTTTAIHGKILGIPDYVYALGLVVRKDWLAKYHLPKPTTWATFLKDAKAFKSHGHTGFAESYQILNGAFGWMYETWLYAAGSPAFVPASRGSGWVPVFQHPAGVATARFLRTLQQDGVISANAVTLPWPQTYTQFTDGQAGMVIAANNIIPGIQQAGLGGKVEVLPMPHPPKPFGKPTALGGGEVYFINSHAPNKQGALDLLRWMLTKKFQVNEVTGAWAKGAAAAGAASEMADLSNVNAAALRGNNPLDLGFQKILEGPVRQEPPISNYTALKTDLSQSLVDIMVNHAKAASTMAALAKKLLPLAK